MEELEKIDRCRRLARRRMAYVSFIILMVEALGITAGLFFGGPLFATNITAASTVLVGLFWTQAAIIGAYLGVSLAEALKKPNA